jgi:hypothetical protein
LIQLRLATREIKKEEQVYQPTNQPPPKKKGCRERKCESGREKKRSCKQQLKRKSPAPQFSASENREIAHVFVGWLAGRFRSRARRQRRSTRHIAYFFFSFFLSLYIHIYLYPFFPFLFRVLSQNRKEKKKSRLGVQKSFWT